MIKFDGQLSSHYSLVICNLLELSPALPPITHALSISCSWAMRYALTLFMEMNGCMVSALWVAMDAWAGCACGGGLRAVRV